MKTIFKTMLLISALCMVLTAFASCGGETTPAEPETGAKQETSSQEAANQGAAPASIVGVWKSDGYVLEFKEDGTYRHNAGAPANYKVEGDILTLINQGVEAEATLAFDGNDQLSMTRNGQTIYLTRLGASGVVAGALVGKWESTNEEGTATLEFTEDAKVYTQEMAYADYIVTEDKIAMVNIFGNGDNCEIYTYKLDGDTLELAMNGQTIVCTRVK